MLDYNSQPDVIMDDASHVRETFEGPPSVSEDLQLQEVQEKLSSPKS